jgi:hypothetical protein
VTPVGHLCGPRASGSTWLALCHLDFGVQNLDIQASVRGSPPSWTGSPPISYSPVQLQYLECRELQCFELRPKCHLQHILQSHSYIKRLLFRSRSRIMSLGITLPFTSVSETWMVFFFFSFLGWGGTESTWYVSHYLASPGWWWVWGTGGMRISRGNWSTLRKPAPSATLPTTNPHNLGLNLGRRGGKPATNSLSYGTARPESLIFKLCAMPS